MASLTHVCMWIGNGWKRITVEQAAKLHPGGTVSARSGLFMCELCGQYVTLTDEGHRTRYFKHSAYEKSKECPERTFGPSITSSYESQEHELPIRIVNISSSSFSFEVGLIRVPKNLIAKNLQIILKPKEAYFGAYIITKERLRQDAITYLPLGERPFKNYILDLQNCNRELRNFWPEAIKGIDPEGTLFERSSGKKILYDADVRIQNEYYLLKRGYEIDQSQYNSIKIVRVAKKQYDWEVWTLYLVSASDLNEEAARFFLNFHCRLTDNPVLLQPVWPLFVEGNYIIKHNQSSIYMLVEGNAASFKTFPSSTVHRLINNSTQLKLYEVFCSNRQQLISVGRTRALEYTYFWQEPLIQEGKLPEIKVTDGDENQIFPGETYILPSKKMLHVQSPYDGYLIILKNDNLIEKRKIIADVNLEFGDITFGLSIQVIIGLDVVWQIDFKKQRSIIPDDGMKLLKYITAGTGATIPLPHSLRNILAGMKRFPEICQWIRKCIKKGCINEQSYRRLQDVYRKNSINK